MKRQVGSGQVSRTAHELRQLRRKSVQSDERRFPRRHGFGAIVDVSHSLVGSTGPICGQVAVRAALELGGQLREFPGVAVERRLPGGFTIGAGRCRIPRAGDVLGNLEGRMRPSQRFTARGNLVITKRRTVRARSALLVRRAEANDGLAGNQRGPLCVGHGGVHGGSYSGGVMSIDIGNDLPAVRFKTLYRVVGKPGVGLAVDRDPVVVVETNELAKLPGTCQRAGLV